MNRKSLLFSATALCFGTGLWAQETKTYKETFNVGDDTVLKINTSHADIEFETWDKDEVEIVATVTLENADKEDSESFFAQDPIKIMGNSKEIEISTSSRTWNFLYGGETDFDFNFEVEPLFEAFEIPDLPEIAVLPEMPPMPPMPPIKVKTFDYEAYKKDGEKYIKKWSKNFEKEFDKEYQKEMEEWAKHMEERAKDWEERNADRLEKMEARMEERAAKMEKRAEERAHLMEERAEKREQLMEERALLAEKRKAEKVKARASHANNLFFSNEDGDAPRAFYFSSDGEGKKYEVKKTIKIKMPKSVKLKMNVKHGEVKLASATKNINASLRYASLLATTIDGSATQIEAAYSPMVVELWNAGKLNTKYSDKVKLVKVKDVDINATSSNIVIDNVLHTVHLVNDLGKTQINGVAPEFKSVILSLKNGELTAALPKATCNVNIVDKLSEISYPESIKANVVKTGNGYEIQGYVNTKKANSPVFQVNAAYSEVVIKD